MEILLTGATGNIGREVLNELLQVALSGKFDSKIICLARSSQYATATQRITEIIKKIAIDLKTTEGELSKFIQIIDTSNDVPRSYSSLIYHLKKVGSKELRVIHLASSANLSTTANSEDEIYTQSYLNTMDLLERIIPYIKQFSFVSTAFSCGHQSGLIPDEYGTLCIKANRNYYERFKLEAERKIKQICELRGIHWQIMRPAIVCGSLINAPLFYTSKFNLLYTWARFFYDLKAIGINCEGIRIKSNKEAGINVVPSDYVAKAIVRAFFKTDIRELNITSSHNISISKLVSSMLTNIGIKTFKLVDEVPVDLGTAEKIYYETIGQQISPYINTPEFQFDTRLLRMLMHDVPEPDVTNNLTMMLDYAIAKEFKDELV